MDILKRNMQQNRLNNAVLLKTALFSLIFLFDPCLFLMAKFNYKSCLLSNGMV